mgnify:CR=1 FL=1
MWLFFSGCAQNGMGKIDALEGIFMSGVGVGMVRKWIFERKNIFSRE